MNKYDPNKALDGEAWLQLDDETRIRLAETAHVVLEPWHPGGGKSMRPHAIAHAVAETLVAQGGPGRAALVRLVRQGLRRHEAIHAIGSFLDEHARSVAGARAKLEDVDPALARTLGSLTAHKWQAGGAAGKNAANRAERRGLGKSRPSASRSKAARKKKKKKRKK